MMTAAERRTFDASCNSGTRDGTLVFVWHEESSPSFTYMNTSTESCSGNVALDRDRAGFKGLRVQTTGTREGDGRSAEMRENV